MTVEEIYKKLGIPPNLAEHMFRVAGVVLFIQKHWTGEEVDWKMLSKAAVLHDVGNIVTFDNGARDEAIKKFGPDDHKATESMLRKIGITEEIIEIILDKGFVNSIAVANSKNWLTKILLYADYRVEPHGISSMKDRLEEVIIKRGKHKDRPDLPELFAACNQVEKQIQENLNIPVDKITNESVNKLLSSQNFANISV